MDDAFIHRTSNFFSFISHFFPHILLFFLANLSELCRNELFSVVRVYLCFIFYLHFFSKRICLANIVFFLKDYYLKNPILGAQSNHHNHQAQFIRFTAFSTIIEMDLDKILFLKLLDLEEIIPENDSSEILEKSKLVLSSQNTLLDKNNSIKTGYENFYIKKGTKKFFPSKDFDFIGQQIVCQKCYKKFASQFSYKVHINTSICVKPCNGPNLTYLKYKNRNGKGNRTKPKINSMEDIHDTKKYLLNPEMLNTLQTRNKCYSDIVHKRNEVIKRNKEKRANYSNKNDESLVTKSRGSPRKHIVPRRRGRPKKSNPVTVDSESQNDHSLNTKSNNAELEEPRMVIVRKGDDKYTHNVDKDFSSEMKILSGRFLEIYNTAWTQVEVTDEFQYSSKNHDQSGCNKEEENINSAVKEKEISLNIKMLEHDLNFLSEQFKDRNEHSYRDQLKFMLSKLHEKCKKYNQNKLKKTEMNTGETEIKENIQLTIKKNKEETDKNIETYVETCLDKDNGDAVSPSELMISNDDCESDSCVKIITLGKESTSLDNVEENTKTYKENVTMNYMSLIKHRLTEFNDSSCYDSMLICKKCKKKCSSIIEMKIHHYEHLNTKNENFLCIICGLQFKDVIIYEEHINAHRKSEQFNLLFKCQVCDEQFDLPIPYFSHVKTHK